MKRIFFNCLLGVACFAGAPRMRAQSTFASALLSPISTNTWAVGGGVRVTVTGGEVSFQATMFGDLLSGVSLEPVLVTEHKVTAFSFGTGTLGSWPIGEFLGPVPGIRPMPAPCGLAPGIDPGFGIPPYFDGTRFTGSFTAFPGLEHLLLSRGGTLYLQVHGAVDSLQDPLFSAPLVHLAALPTLQFTASFSGANEIPPNASPYRGSGSFGLTGNCLSYSLAVDMGFPGFSVGIYGPAGWHTSSTNLVADFGALLGVLIPGGQAGFPGEIVYSGQLSLNDEQVEQLIHGRLFVNFLTAQYPEGEIRGQIRPVHEAR